MSRIFCYGLMIIYTVFFSASAIASVKSEISKEVVETIIEYSAKTNTKLMFSEPTKKMAVETFEKIAKQQGKNSLKLMDDFGLELINKIEIYGDEFAKVFVQISPQSQKILLKNADDLFPIIKSIGLDVLEFETKSPGMTKTVFNEFGEELGKSIIKVVHTQDVPRFLRYAQKADNHETKKLLLKQYRVEKSALFERIPAKLVLASGLSASMLYGTHELTKPIRALETAITENVDVANTAVRNLFAWTTFAFLFIASILFWRFGLMPWQRERKNNQ